MSKHDFFPKGIKGSMVVFENCTGASIISTIKDVQRIAAEGNGPDHDVMASAHPTQQQAQEALSKLGHQMN